jgi:hypothetical protein
VEIEPSETGPLAHGVKKRQRTKDEKTLQRKAGRATVEASQNDKQD